MKNTDYLLCKLTDFFLKTPRSYKLSYLSYKGRKASGTMR